MAELSEADLEAARTEMTEAITKFARLTEFIDDDQIITNYVVATVIESMTDPERGTETGCITSHAMPRWQIHGLLHYVDSSIVSGDIISYGDDDDDL